MTKYTKEAVDYSRGMQDRHCGSVFKDDKGYCKHFEKPSSCKLVEGFINPIYWCRKFEKAEK